MPKDIHVNYTIRDQTKRLQITVSSQGTGQIMMDNYYHGQVVFNQDQWRAYLSDKSALSKSDDMAALVEILNRHI